MTRRVRRRWLPALAAAAGLLAAAITSAQHATATGLSLTRSTTSTIVHGVTVRSISWNNAHGYQHGFVMSIDLTVRGLHLRPGLGHAQLNNRETTESMAARNNAVAAINGDFFDWTTSVPLGGIAIDGHVYKTPAASRVSQLYVTSTGKVGIGALRWTGSVAALSSTGKVLATHALPTVNKLDAANSGRLTMITPAIMSERLKGCPAVLGTLDRRVLTVTHVYSQLTRFPQLLGRQRILAACSTSGRWLRTHAPLHQRLRLATSLTTPAGAKVANFISGERTLRLNGRAYDDRSGVHTSGINPETAVCVSRDHAHVRLVTVDGWLSWSGNGNGITLGELGDLTAALDCYSAVVFDGGGSTTMVARSGGALHVVNKVPVYYGQRPVSDALLVVQS